MSLDNYVVFMSPCFVIGLFIILLHAFVFYLLFMYYVDVVGVVNRRTY